ncbi:uncharacterized protein akap12a isoform X2 [Electrophorus electricus]|uniref:uncharacterized protein akap12a isoform X2 n=1 Tax=Electrophorus electricus TaxID=8005 RepID=UPI000F0A0DAA|nr:uncharacterized protein akap12a isoform X2 [Electrophorus electricus]
MGATSSSQRFGKFEEEDDEQNTGPNKAQDDIAEDKLLQNNGQDSGLKEKNENQSEELNGHCEDRVIGDDPRRRGCTLVVLLDQGKQSHRIFLRKSKDLYNLFCLELVITNAMDNKEHLFATPPLASIQLPPSQN